VPDIEVVVPQVVVEVEGLLASARRSSPSVAIAPSQGVLAVKRKAGGKTPADCQLERVIAVLAAAVL